MRKDIFKSEIMVHCAAIDCTNGSSKKNDESINFFKLPKDPERKKLWISKLKREKLPEEENIYVCHFHFDSSCFKRNFRVYSTGILEVYHSVLNKWAPKSTYFSYKDMVARFKVSAINSNQGEALEQAKTWR